MQQCPVYCLLNVKEEYRKTAMKLLACNVWSKMHDLTCGHRVQQVDGRSVCGSNCKHDSASKQAFEGAQRRVCQESGKIICPVCTFKSIAGGKGIKVVGVCDAEPVVEVQELRGLRLMLATGARYNRCMEKMFAQGYRRAEPMVETDYLAELVRQNLGIVVGAEEVPGLQMMMDGVQVVTEEEEMGDVSDVVG